MTTPPITRVLRDSIFEYFNQPDDRDKLLYFNKIVDICTSNTTKLMIPARNKGVGSCFERPIKDNPIRDFAEEYVAEFLYRLRTVLLDTVRYGCESGLFDFQPRRFKQRVINRIRDIKRSHEEDLIEDLPEWVDDLHDEE